LTQKKGALTDHEAEMLFEQKIAWGCDLCQENCPHTRSAIQNGTIFSPIPFFQEKTIPHLTTEILDGMTDEAFATRAYSWRGRDTVARNLKILEKTTK
jgi:epoxyqueuosine reductase QueG